MGKKNRTQPAKKTPRRTSTRKRNRTEKGSYYDQYFEESEGLTPDQTPLQDKSVKETAKNTEDPQQEPLLKKQRMDVSPNVSVSHSEGHASTTCTEDHGRGLVEDTSEDTEGLIFTQQTPKVLTDRANMTPKIDTASTPEIMCIGRTNRGNSVNLKHELEQAEGSSTSDENSDGNENTPINENYVSPEINFNNSTGTLFLNNLYELHLYNQSKCTDATELETKVDKQEERIETLVREKKELEIQVEKYGDEMFKKEQKMKIMADRVKQLQNDNNYRKEVTRLEEVVEQREGDLRQLKEELKKSKDINIQAVADKQEVKEELETSMEKERNLIKELEESNIMMEEVKIELEKSKEKVIILEENKTFLLNENTVLKNEVKLLKMNERVDEESQNNHQPRSGDKPDELQEMSKGLCSLQKELSRFKKFTFRKLDELAGRDCSSSSLCSSDDQESGEESDAVEVEVLTSPQPQPQKKTTSPRHKHRKNAGSKQEIKVPSVTLRYEGNSPPTAALSPDESGQTIPLVPGHQLYSDKVRASTASPESTDYDEEEKARKIEGIRERRQARESKTIIFSSSITRDVTRKQREFNEKCSKSNVVFHQFNGKKASEIVKYMIPHLEDEQPSSVVFVAGGNDLPNKDISIEEIKKIANCLVEGGLRCRGEYGVNDVYISSIMPRSHSEFQGNRHRLNNILREMCESNDFTFIDNNNIVLSTHGHHDGVHLNYEGSNLLGANLLSVLNR